MVVSMRYIQKSKLDTVTDLTFPLDHVHGAPIHYGNPGFLFFYFELLFHKYHSLELCTLTIKEFYQVSIYVHIYIKVLLTF